MDFLRSMFGSFLIFGFITFAYGELVTVDAEALNAQLGGSDFNFVLYCMDWTPQCKEEAIPEFAKLSTSFNKGTFSVIDCDKNQANQEFCDAQKVKAVPTIRIYKDSKVVTEFPNRTDYTQENLNHFIKDGLTTRPDMQTGKREEL